ncbi:MAG: hypothetical protein JXA37_13725 [Chloroflexia bacterium]|nr:hypothetical protein [Chloroflexia bacterium]
MEPTGDGRFPPPSPIYNDPYRLGGETFDTSVHVQQAEETEFSVQAEISQSTADYTGFPQTLYIALGGTGLLILTVLKALYTRIFGAGQWPQSVRFLAFDTANEHILVDGVRLESGSEFIHIGQVPVPRIVQNLSRHEAIQARLGDALKQLPAVTLRKGAKQTRILGLIALLWNFAQVEQRIKDALWALAERDRGGAIHGVNVVILNSLGGGTGSGMFLDVAMLVRDLIASMGELSSYCQVIGVGVLPKALVGIEGPNIVANSVAAIKEIDRLMLGDGFSMPYPTGRVIESRSAPFDLYYLIDGVDEHGLTWRRLEDVTQMIARGIYLQMGSQIGQKGENIFDNLEQVLTGQTPDGEGTFFGSFGVADLVWPAPQVVNQLAWRLLGKVLTEALLQPAAPDRAQGLAQKALRLLAPEAIRAFLARDEGGTPLGVTLEVPARLAQVPVERRPIEARRHVQEYLRLRIRGNLAQVIENHREELSQQLFSAIEAEVEQLVRDPAGGLRAAALAMGTIRAEANRQLELAGNLQEEKAALLERVSRAVEDRAQALELAAEGWLFRGRNTDRATEAYFKAATQQARAALDLLVEESHAALLADLDRFLVDLTQVIHTLTANLGALEARAAQESGAPLFPGRESTVISLADPPYLEQLYQDYAPALEETLESLCLDESLLAWEKRAPAELNGTLLGRAAGPFAPLAKLTVEQVLEARHQERSAAAWYGDLLKVAAPSWSIDRTRLSEGGNDLARIVVLGVYDANESLFGTLCSSLVTTRDPYRVTLLLSTVGAPYCVIQNFDDYHRRYQQVRSRQQVHVMPDFQGGQNEFRLAFALGSLFGMIRAEGNYFYYHPLDEVRHGHRRLGNGLEQAVRSLIEEEGLTGEIMERVNAHIAQIGVHQALETLDAYWNSQETLAGRHAELIREFRVRVREFAHELREISQIARELN